ncbi:hypothetical protein Fmac_011375 [Flemingia macrophylla]|uniref:Uncharacterized protein n=1 Tax=Flemingia macrophylla TaxID=520843 RepID=A0ABD1MM91_9FABA
MDAVPISTSVYAQSAQSDVITRVEFITFQQKMESQFVALFEYLKKSLAPLDVVSDNCKVRDNQKWLRILKKEVLFLKPLRARLCGGKCACKGHKFIMESSLLKLETGRRPRAEPVVIVDDSRPIYRRVAGCFMNKFFPSGYPYRFLDFS